jgi:hypothetical protein
MVPKRIIKSSSSLVVAQKPFLIILYIAFTLCQSNCRYLRGYSRTVKTTGTPIGPNDFPNCNCIAHNLNAVTHVLENFFSRVPGLLAGRLGALTNKTFMS